MWNSYQTGKRSAKIGSVESHANDSERMENFMSEEVHAGNQSRADADQSNDFDGDPELKFNLALWHETLKKAKTQKLAVWPKRKN